MGDSREGERTSPNRRILKETFARGRYGKEKRSVAVLERKINQPRKINRGDSQKGELKSWGKKGEAFS